MTRGEYVRQMVGHMERLSLSHFRACVWSARELRKLGRWASGEQRGWYQGRATGYVDEAHEAAEHVRGLRALRAELARVEGGNG
jgi:hypothetical protein